MSPTGFLDGGALGKMPSAKRPAKRPAELARVASHAEVYRLIRRRKVVDATELYKIAQEQGEAGNQQLLLYCSGENGMKQNLQAVVNAMWGTDTRVQALATVESLAGASAAENPDAEHLTPLCPARLKALQSALMPKEEVQGKRRITKAPATGVKQRILDGKSRKSATPVKKDPKVVKVEEPFLFDHYGRQAEVMFRPRCGVWRLRDLYEILLTCRSNPGLGKVKPSPAPEGGVIFCRSEGGWRAMLKAGVAQPRLPFAELTEEQLQSQAPEARLGSGCGALPWERAAPSSQAKKVAPEDQWITEMPKAANFEKDTVGDSPLEERLVRFWARGHVEDVQWAALVAAIEACKHTVMQTKGFDMKKGQFRVTASNKYNCKHKTAAGAVPWGAIEAHGGVMEEKSRVKPRYLLNNSLSSQDRPARCPKLAQATRAIAGLPGGRLKTLKDKPSESLSTTASGSASSDST